VVAVTYMASVEDDEDANCALDAARDLINKAIGMVDAWWEAKHPQPQEEAAS
jgi:hypothetical protein